MRCPGAESNLINGKALSTSSQGRQEVPAPERTNVHSELSSRGQYGGRRELLRPVLPLHSHATLNLVSGFQMRTCDIEIDGKLPRPCLEYHLKRCLGPCVKGLCTQDEYQQAARDVKVLLEGKNKELANDLKDRMWHFSETHNYELAAKYRDLHKTVLALGEQQKMATTADHDVDILGFYRENHRLALQLFTMREGRIVGRREFFWEDLPEDGEFNASEFLGEVACAVLFDRLRPLESHVR